MVLNCQMKKQSINMNKQELQIELIKNVAIQEYLLSVGSNDEKINTKIRNIQSELLELERTRNK